MDPSALLTFIGAIALLIIVHGVIIGARDITRGSQSFFGVPRETDLIVAAVAAVLALLVAWLFKASVPGLKLRASREDLIAAQAVGIDARRYRLLAWVVSAVPARAPLTVAMPPTMSMESSAKVSTK